MPLERQGLLRKSFSQKDIKAGSNDMIPPTSPTSTSESIISKPKGLKAKK